MIIAWRDWEGWLNFVFFDHGRVQDKKERDERTWGKTVWQTGTSENRVWESSTIPNMAGTSCNLACDNIESRTSKPSQASRTPDSSYPLTSALSFPSSCTIFHTHPPLYHHCRAQKYVIPRYLSKQWYCVTPKYSIYWVHPTPSTAYPKYSIHPTLSGIRSFSWLQVDPWMYLQRSVCCPTQLAATSAHSMTAAIQSDLMTFPRSQVN